MSASSTEGATGPVRLERRLGATTAAALIVGSMIGSGIYLAPSLMARLVATPGVFLALWLVGGGLTVAGALSFAELAAALPRAGGQYVYLREAYGPLVGFLFGWAQFAVVQCGFNAAVSVGFAKYLGVFLPSVSETHVVLSVAGWSLSTAQLVAIGVIIVLTAINMRGVREGAAVQNLLTAIKVLSLLALAVLPFALHRATPGEPSHYAPLVGMAVPAGVTMGFFAALAVAMSKTLAVYDAWNNVTFVAEEVREPERTLPRALCLGTLAVTALYLGANLAYLRVLPLGAIAAAPEGRVASLVMTRVVGDVGAPLIAGAILVSTFGCVNGLILGGARMLYAMARDGLFFANCGELSTRATPTPALALQALWSIALAATGSYDALLTYIEFASLGWSALTVAALFVLRRRQPELARPYRVWGYPLVPTAYVAVSLFFMVFMVVGDARDALLGAAIIAAGVPIYSGFRRGLRRRRA